MVQHSGPTSRRRAPAGIVSVLLLGAGAIGLAACGSTTAASSTTTMPPGFESGFWVGTGSATDQQIVYTAKLAYFLTALGLQPDAQFVFTATEWQRELAYQAQVQADGIVLKPGSNLKDPAGVKPAAFTITQQPVIPRNSTTNQAEATVKICAIVTAHGVFKASGVNVPGLLGYTGPVLTTTKEVETSSGGWLVSYSSAQTTSSCPPGHTPPS